MAATLCIGIALFVMLPATPAAGADSLLFETWFESHFHPSQADQFIDGHRAQYTDEYFACSREAQRLIKEEVRIRDRQCDFAADSGVRGRCRRDNQLRGIDQHLAALDDSIRGRKAWLDAEAGRTAVTAVKAAEDFEKTCKPAACDIAKRKKNELLRDLKSLLQCPPARPSDVDPSFKTFQLPSDAGP
jgi:hypothetical protein